MLRAATWPSHQRLEKRIDVKSRFASLAAYRTHLRDLHGFVAALESRLAIDAFGDALPDYPARRKLALLEKKAAAYDRAQAALAEAKQSKGGITPETMSKIEAELKLL